MGKDSHLSLWEWINFSQEGFLLVSMDQSHSQWGDKIDTRSKLGNLLLPTQSPGWSTVSWSTIFPIFHGSDGHLMTLVLQVNANNT